MKRLAGKVAIVTGGSGGIGRATAIEFARQGAAVALQYRSREGEAQSVVRQIQAEGGRAMVGRVDLSSPPQRGPAGEILRDPPAEEMEDFVRQVLADFQHIDILAAVAGLPVGDLWAKPALAHTRQDFYAPLDVDLYGTFLACRLVAPVMLRQGGGVILTISSTPALAGHHRGFAFTVAKAAILGLTRALALELAPTIRVNAIAPGNIATDWLRQLTPEEQEEARLEAPLRRWGSPEDVARALAYLASDESGFITGQTLVVDGGTVIR